MPVENSTVAINLLMTATGTNNITAAMTQVSNAFRQTSAQFTNLTGMSRGIAAVGVGIENMAIRAAGSILKIRDAFASLPGGAGGRGSVFWSVWGGQGIRDLGNTVTQVGQKITQFYVNATKASADYQRQLTEIINLQEKIGGTAGADATRQEVTRSNYDTARKYGTTREDVGNAGYWLQSAGYQRGTKIFDTMERHSIELALAAGEKQEPASKAMIAAQRAFNLTTDRELSAIGPMIFGADMQGILKIPDLPKEIGRTGALAGLLKTRNSDEKLGLLAGSLAMTAFGTQRGLTPALAGRAAMGLLDTSVLQSDDPNSATGRVHRRIFGEKWNSNMISKMGISNYYKKLFSGMGYLDNPDDPANANFVARDADSEAVFGDIEAGSKKRFGLAEGISKEHAKRLAAGMIAGERAAEEDRKNNPNNRSIFSLGEMEEKIKGFADNPSEWDTRLKNTSTDMKAEMNRVSEAFKDIQNSAAVALLPIIKLVGNVLNLGANVARSLGPFNLLVFGMAQVTMWVGKLVVSFSSLGIIFQKLVAFSEGMLYHNYGNAVQLGMVPGQSPTRFPGASYGGPGGASGGPVPGGPGAPPSLPPANTYYKQQRAGGFLGWLGARFGLGVQTHQMAPVQALQTMEGYIQAIGGSDPQLADVLRRGVATGDVDQMELARKQVAAAYMKGAPPEGVVDKLRARSGALHGAAQSADVAQFDAALEKQKAENAHRFAKGRQTFLEDAKAAFAGHPDYMNKEARDALEQSLRGSGKAWQTASTEAILASGELNIADSDYSAKAWQVQGLRERVAVLKEYHAAKKRQKAAAVRAAQARSAVADLATGKVPQKKADGTTNTRYTTLSARAADLTDAEYEEKSANLALGAAQQTAGQLFGTPESVYSKIRYKPEYLREQERELSDLRKVRDKADSKYKAAADKAAKLGDITTEKHNRLQAAEAAQKALEGQGWGKEAPTTKQLEEARKETAAAAKEAAAADRKLAKATDHATKTAAASALAHQELSNAEKARADAEKKAKAVDDGTPLSRTISSAGTVAKTFMGGIGQMLLGSLQGMVAAAILTGIVVVVKKAFEHLAGAADTAADKLKKTGVSAEQGAAYSDKEESGKFAPIKLGGTTYNSANRAAYEEYYNAVSETMRAQDITDPTKQAEHMADVVKRATKDMGTFASEEQARAAWRERTSAALRKEYGIADDKPIPPEVLAELEAQLKVTQREGYLAPSGPGPGMKAQLYGIDSGGVNTPAQRAFEAIKSLRDKAKADQALGAATGKNLPSISQLAGVEKNQQERDSLLERLSGRDEKGGYNPLPPDMEREARKRLREVTKDLGNSYLKWGADIQAKGIPEDQDNAKKAIELGLQYRKEAAEDEIKVALELNSLEERRLDTMSKQLASLQEIGIPYQEQMTLLQGIQDKQLEILKTRVEIAKAGGNEVELAKAEKDLQDAILEAAKQKLTYAKAHAQEGMGYTRDALGLQQEYTAALQEQGGSPAEIKASRAEEHRLRQQALRESLAMAQAAPQGTMERAKLMLEYQRQRLQYAREEFQQQAKMNQALGDFVSNMRQAILARANMFRAGMPEFKDFMLGLMGSFGAQSMLGDYLTGGINSPFLKGAGKLSHHNISTARHRNLIAPTFNINVHGETMGIISKLPTFQKAVADLARGTFTGDLQQAQGSRTYSPLPAGDLRYGQGWQRWLPAQ